MQHHCSTYALLAVLFCVVCPAHLLKVGMIAIMPTPVERGVPRTEPPQQGLKKAEVYKPLYKDYYSKTSVVVTFPVSTVLYQEQDLSTIENQTNLYDVSLTATYPVQNITILEPSLRPSVILVPKYDQFDWATETQIYTTAFNSTTTTVVENTVPFL